MTATGAVPAPAAGTAALWGSGFRPFFLAAAVHGALMGVAAGLGHATPAWHGHEMLFGFVAAAAAGFLLTAIPSWAGLPEWRGRGLAGLAALWLAGRLAMLAAPWLDRGLVAAVDLAFLPALLLALAPKVWSARDRRYRLVLPIVAAFAAGNLVHHLGSPTLGNLLGGYASMVLFSFVGGLLTPIFTATALGGDAGFDRRLEVLAPALLVALAACDLAGAPAAAVATAAAAAAGVHALRWSRWQGAAVADTPILAAMHLGYLGLVLALAMLAVVAVAAPDWRVTALHGYFVLGLGLMKLSLMTRVVLKHTGRPVAVPKPMLAGMAAVTLAAALRLAAGPASWDGGLALAAGLLWALPFALYLVLHARMLVSPSLPRPPQPP